MGPSKDCHPHNARRSLIAGHLLHTAAAPAIKSTQNRQYDIDQQQPVHAVSKKQLDIARKGRKIATQPGLAMLWLRCTPATAMLNIRLGRPIWPDEISLPHLFTKYTTLSHFNTLHQYNAHVRAPHFIHANIRHG